MAESKPSDRKIVTLLNGILKNELTAVNQYFLHARMLRNWGVLRLAHHEYEESIGEMKHADRLVQRILMLDGLPNLQDLGKLRIGESIPEILASDLAAETHNQGRLKEAVAGCEKAQDYVSREILEDILDDTEKHIDWITIQVGLIEKVGLQNYIQEQMFGGDDNGD